jgi:hypothetical protein
VRRLNAIINLLIETAELEGKPLSMSKRIELLSAAGLRPIEISQLLSRTPGYVTKELTVMRKSRSKRGSRAPRARVELSNGEQKTG